MPILALSYLLVILLWSFCEDSLLFCKSWHNGVHNCLFICLYVLWSTLILNLKHSISFFSQFAFDEFIVKGGEIVHKVGWTLANRVVERRNMINDYLRGSVCIESVRGSWFQGDIEYFDFKLFLALLCYFAWSCHFYCLLLVFAVFLLLDDLIELFLAFLVF
jgi:hypothetical protein